MNLNNTEQKNLIEICFMLENLDRKKYTESLTRKDGLPLNHQEKKSTSNVPILHKYLLSKTFTDDTAYYFSFVVDWLKDELGSNKNADNIFIYSEQSRFSNFNYCDLYNLLDRNKLTPFKDQKHTSELLEIMHHCIADNWEEHDPSKPPKNEGLKKWFKDKYPDNKRPSDSMITAMCTIMRPDKYK